MTRFTWSLGAAGLLAAMVIGLHPTTAAAQVHRLNNRGMLNELGKPERTSYSLYDRSYEDLQLQRLQTVVDCDFKETPLDDVVKYLQEQTSVRLFVDDR